jgi:hypothetical protein
MTHTDTTVRTLASALALGILAAAGACAKDPVAELAAKGIAPVYNEQTGKLEQLLSDRDGNGSKETRAFMDGTAIKRIEIDRNDDDSPDRWEYYTANVIERAEEANGQTSAITRREFFAAGVIRRVVDDVDADGRPDKWELYEASVLRTVELDLVGKGYASQRLTYGADGNVTAIDTDPDGDGTFVPVPINKQGGQS